MEGDPDVEASSTDDALKDETEKTEAVCAFFPATAEGFVAKCGPVTAVKKADFEDAHRRRHLEAFQRSCHEWATHSRVGTLPIADVDAFLLELVEKEPKNAAEFAACQRDLMRRLHIAPSKSQLLQAIARLTAAGTLAPAETKGIERFLLKKAVRTQSGVLVITVLTSPGEFSCPHDCYYCPNEPGQPRSYLSSEPAVLRANQNGWDCALQFWDRAETLFYNGHIIDKIEVLVLGGTWSGYPRAYQEEFCRDIFYAANVFNEYLAARQREMDKAREQLAEEQECAASDDKRLDTCVPAPNRVAFDASVTNSGSLIPPITPDVLATSSAGTLNPSLWFLLPREPAGMRPRLSLEEEQLLNEKADCKVIGLTLETRPDKITPRELKLLRRFGCTRVQLGIQHTDDDVLLAVNRGHTRAQAAAALKLLKDACFKVDIHLMPDLPTSSPNMDAAMFEDVLSSPELQADQWKIYPCEVTPYSTIERWYHEGSFKPYAENNMQALTRLLVFVKVAVHPWIRLNRVVRDIPNPSIIAGNSDTNLRQVLLDCMGATGARCRCLRCREIKNIQFEEDDRVLTEFFISYETKDELRLFGFLRLRLPLPGRGSSACTKRPYFPELQGSALIRELHVYGKVVGSKERKADSDSRPQHSGIGQRLLCVAEVISATAGFERLAVIAGVGTRDYYRKHGYEVEGLFMTKTFDARKVYSWMRELLIGSIVIQDYSIETVLNYSDFSATQNATPVPSASNEERFSNLISARKVRPRKQNGSLKSTEENPLGLKDGMLDRMIKSGPIEVYSLLSEDGQTSLKWRHIAEQSGLSTVKWNRHVRVCSALTCSKYSWSLQKLFGVSLAGSAVFFAFACLYLRRKHAR